MCFGVPVKQEKHRIFTMFLLIALGRIRTVVTGLGSNWPFDVTPYVLELRSTEKFPYGPPYGFKRVPPPVHSASPHMATQSTPHSPNGQSPQDVNIGQPVTPSRYRSPRLGLSRE